MTFVIDVGKCYETRDGRVSSKTYEEEGDAAIYAVVDGKSYRYWPSGRADLVHESPMDLVKEWSGAVMGSVKHFMPRKKAAELTWPETPDEIAFWTGNDVPMNPLNPAEPTFSLQDITDATPIKSVTMNDPPFENTVRHSLGVDGPVSGDVEYTSSVDGGFVFIKTGEGRKDDTGKLPYELIAPEFLEEIAKVLEFGARKYAPRNWEHGMAWGRCFGALMRHMWSWWRGEEKDAETGFSHLAHAGCCLMFLTAYERRGTGTDNRWKGKPNAE